MFFENETVILDTTVSYEIMAGIQLSPGTKKKIENSGKAEMLVSLVADDGDAKIRSFLGTEVDAKNEYRRIAGLPPRENYPKDMTPDHRLKTENSAMEGMKKTGILVTYKGVGKLPLPPKAVAASEEGLIPAFKINIDTDGKNNGMIKATVAGTSLYEGRKEMIRVNEVIAARKKKEQGDNGNNNNSDTPSGSGNNDNNDLTGVRYLRGMGRASRSAGRGFWRE